MRAIVMVMVTSLLSTVAVGQGQPAGSATGKSAPEAKTQPAGKTEKPASSLRGCVSPKPDASGTYTITQEGSSSRFRLTGRSMRDYAGKMVEVVLAETKGLTIKGGLVPSPNVAAQAGHLDSARAAVASQPGANDGKSDAALPEFRVNRVRALGTSCEP